MKRRELFAFIAGAIATFVFDRARGKRGLRISTDENDPGYATWAALPRGPEGWPRIKTFLDGIEHGPTIITADEEEGFVYRAVLDADGHFQVDPDPNNPDAVWMETVYGNVRIVLPS